MCIRDRLQGAFYHLCQWLLLGPVLALTRTRYFGVPDIGAVRSGLLIASNHQSFLDPVLVGVSLVRPISYLARRSLFRIHGLNALLRAVRTHPVRRGGVDRAALRTVRRLLAGGEAILIFPEGTRTADGSLGRFKPGVASLAIRHGVPVLPVCIEGAFACWPRTQVLPRPGRVAVAYGRLLDPTGKAPDELTQLVRDEIERLRESLRDYLVR